MNSTTPHHEMLLDAVQHGVVVLEATQDSFRYHASIAQNLGQLAAASGEHEVKMIAIDALTSGKERAIGYAKVAAVTCQETDALIVHQEFSVWAAVQTVLRKRNEYCISSDAVEVYSHFPASFVLHQMAQKYDVGNRMTRSELNLSAGPYFEPIELPYDGSETEAFTMSAMSHMRLYAANANPDFVDAAIKNALIELATNGKLHKETTQAVTAICTALMDMGKTREAEAFLKAAHANDTFRQLDHDADFPLLSTKYLQVSEALKLTNPDVRAAELAKTYAFIARQQKQASIGLPVTPLPHELQGMQRALLQHHITAPPKRRWLKWITG